MTKPDRKPDHREFRLDCNCHTPLHFIQFDWDRWHDGTEDINAFFVSDRNWGFWKRVRCALKYVFGTQDLIQGDVVVAKAKAKELAAFLKEVAGES